MAVIKVGERVGMRSAAERENGSRSYSRTYYVESDRTTDGAGVILQATALPQLFDQYQIGGDIDQQAWCVSRTPKQIGPKHWEVEIEYDSQRDSKTQKDPKDPNSKTDDPAEWWPKVSWTFEISQQPCQVALEEPTSQADGKPGFVGVVNSAGEPFDPPAMMDIATPVITFETYSQTFDTAAAMRYINAVNSDNFWNAAQRQLKISQISTSGLQAKKIGPLTIYFYAITVEMKFRRETWDLEILDVGTYYIDTGVKYSFLTADGQPYIGRLDKAGGKLADNAADKFMTYKVYRELPFNALGLPPRMP